MSSDIRNDVVLKRTGCIYHDRKWSSKVQFIINQLHGKIIPGPFAKKVSIICTCKEGNDENFEKYRNTSYKTLVNSLKEAIKSKPLIWRNTNADNTAGNELERLMNDEFKESLTSRRRLLLVIQACMDNDYGIFKEVATNKKTLWKSKYSHSESFELKFDGQRIPFIIGSKGKHIKEICRNNDCLIEITKPQELQHPPRRGRGGYGGRLLSRIGRTDNSFIAEIKAHSKEDMENAYAQLEMHIVKISKRRLTHEENVEHFIMKRTEHLERVRKNREAKREYTAAHNARYDALMKFSKETAGEDFQIKKFHSGQDKRKIRSKKQDKSQTKFGHLVGGHCKQCHVSFEAPETMFSTKCRYHPGYLETVSKGVDYYLTSPENIPEPSTSTKTIPVMPQPEESDKEYEIQNKSRKHHHYSDSQSRKKSSKKLKPSNNEKEDTCNEDMVSAASSSSSGLSTICCGHVSVEADGLSDKTVGQHLNQDTVDKSLRGNTVQKWSCCDVINFEVPTGSRMKKQLYNSIHAGCATGIHQYVPAKAKEKQSKRAHKKSEAVSPRDLEDWE